MTFRAFLHATLALLSSISCHIILYNSIPKPLPFHSFRRVLSKSETAVFEQAQEFDLIDFRNDTFPDRLFSLYPKNDNKTRHRPLRRSVENAFSPRHLMNSSSPIKNTKHPEIQPTVSDRPISNRVLSPFRFSAISPEAAAATIDVNLSSSSNKSQSFNDTVEQEETADKQLQDYLTTVARSRPHTKKRSAPRLRRTSDGSFIYNGNVFKARITKDGYVKFKDQNRPFTFDLTDIIEKNILGNEIYTAEKRRFLQETVDVQEKTRKSSQEKAMSRAKRRMLGRLILIKEDNHKSNLTKREMIFVVWDECSDDDIGRQAQELIERFVRNEMPKNSLLGYSVDELISLNQRRVSRRAFNPYNDFLPKKQ